VGTSKSAFCSHGKQTIHTVSGMTFVGWLCSICSTHGASMGSIPDNSDSVAFHDLPNRHSSANLPNRGDTTACQPNLLHMHDYDIPSVVTPVIKLPAAPAAADLGNH
jgi:hypothetical protein